MKPEPTPAPPGLRQQAEAELAETPEAEASVTRSVEDTARLLHELQVHQVELELQNQELRGTQVALEASRSDYADLYDHAPVGYLTLSEAGQILRANLLACRLLDMSREQLLALGLSDLVLRDDQDAYYLFRRRVKTNLEDQSAELRLRRPDGSLFWAELVGAGGRGDSDERRLRLVISDIDQRRASQQKLLLAASVFSNAREGIMITDTSGNIISVNDAFSRLTGYSADEVLGQNPRLLNSGRQPPSYFASMWHDLITKGHWYGETWNRRKNGEVYAELQTITSVHDALGITTHYVSLFSDITSFKAHQTELAHIAYYDLLTDLPNRALLADRLHQSMAQAGRRGNLLGLVYIDLDSFKTIKDLHGHEAGDQLLVALAGRMKEALRDGDTLARIGGDEFVAVLTDLSDSAACLPLLQRLLAATSQPFWVAGLQLQVSASLGVSFYPQAEAVEADQLLRQADQAMYQAKQTGKNRYQLFDQDHDRSTRGHHESLARVRLALDAQELLLYYQPKVNMRSGAVVGAEALIRWQHPEQGLLAPGDFLPLMEADPLAIEVGEWVISSVLKQMALWRAQGLDLPVSVNVGALQLQQHDFVARLRAILLRHPEVNASKLSLEILETSALQDIGYASQVIEDCQRLGVSFALDDFGTGYSSLTYLKRLRVALLNIDQSFVRDMLDDPDDRCILEGVVSLAAAFNRKVIAEGVETVAHGSMLLQLDCELAQGYGIARPMPAQAMPAWVQSWKPDAAWVLAAA